MHSSQRSGLKLRVRRSNANVGDGGGERNTTRQVDERAQEGRSESSVAPTEAGSSSTSEIVAQEVLEARRAALVAEKQSELEGVYDRHDTLVREKFHMEAFKMMTAFDPQEAKMENTAVFQEYKAKFDLLEKALPTPGPSRKTRSAHSERKQLLQTSLMSPSSVSPSSPSIPLRRQSTTPSNEISNAPASTRSKGKGKERAQVAVSIEELQPESLSISTSSVGQIEQASSKSTSHVLSISELNGSLSSSHARPSKRMKERHDSHQDESTLPNGNPPVRHPLRPTRSSTRHQNPQTQMLPPDSPSTSTMGSTSKLLDDSNITPSAQISTTAPHVQPLTASSSTLVLSHSSSKKAIPTETTTNNSSQRPIRQLRSTTAATSSQLIPSSSKAGDAHAGATSSSTPLTPLSSSSSTPTVQPPPVPFKHNIKRVRLIVRRPPPMLSNPKQIPPPAKFNSSLGAFLNSYVMLDDVWIGEGKRVGAGNNESNNNVGSSGVVSGGAGAGGGAKKCLDLDEETLQRRAMADAVLLQRIQKFRKQGRLIDGAQYLLESLPTTSGTSTPTPAAGGTATATAMSNGRTRKDVLLASLGEPHPTMQRTSRDVWDVIIEAIVANGKLQAKNKVGSRGRVVAAQVASKVQGYWDGHAARQEKLKLQEEKRLRALAKATIKMVTSEWKRAVFHIREQERLKLEEEERRRGHEHLDAILDQSGHILETQHGDLTRGRSKSRSASVSEVLGAWGSEADNEETDEGEDSDDSREEGAEAEADGDGASSVHDADDEDREFEVERKTLDAELSERERDSDDESDVDGEHEDDEALTAFLIGGSGPNNMERETETGTLEDMMPPGDTEDPEEDGEGEMDEEAGVEGLADSVAMDVDGIDTGLTTEKASPQPQAERTLQIRDSPRPPTRKASGQVRFASDMLEEGGDDEVEPAEQAPSNVVDEEDGVMSTDVTIAGSSPLAKDTKSDAVISEAHDVRGDEDGMKVDASKSEGEEKGRDQDDTPPGDVEELAPAAPSPTPSIASRIPEYLKPYSVAPVDWNPMDKITPPLLLRGVLRPYQQSGLEWLASLHTNNLNGILADEMGLGKTIQTIALLAHLACDRGIWGPHLIIVPTSVLLNWEMEFKKFLPGFRVLSYHGTTKRRKELRQGWNDKHHFNVCITSYTLASRDAHIFKRKPWYYMILDEAHMIKNFRSQRWNILLMFRSFRRLLLTGTPLQNNLTELWALLQFLMSGTNFANLKEFGEWFANPLEKAIEMGNVLDDETLQRVGKLHTVLRPYLLRRLKKDVEKELPSKFEHLVLCPLSKRQRYLYDEFMSRAQTREDLQSGVYQKIANILMQLRKVCNHPDLFEVRPIVTSFAMQRSAIADYEIKELLIRRRLLQEEDESVNLDIFGFRIIERQHDHYFAALETKRLDATAKLLHIPEMLGEPPPQDFRTAEGFKRYSAYLKQVQMVERWKHIAYINQLRCNKQPLFGEGILRIVRKLYKPLLPTAAVDWRVDYMNISRQRHSYVKSYVERADEMSGLINKFTFVTPVAIAKDLPRIAFRGYEEVLTSQPPEFDRALHLSSVKLQIAFPDPSLLQYDCGKLQQLTQLLREKKAGGHRVLLFTQMTRILDILEVFLNYHGYLYLRLDGATKIEDRQYITERFNADSRIFCFIASSRSGGVGINLTGADTVIFYDSDFNPQMDKQCEDRAHRIGQIRDVHIYRFVSKHTVEEAMLRKANQKRSLDDIVIQKGEFDWRTLFDNEGALLTKALGEYEDQEDALAAEAAAREEHALEGADQAEFGGDLDGEALPTRRSPLLPRLEPEATVEDIAASQLNQAQQPEEDEEEGGTVVEYMLAFVQRDWDFFREWRL